MQSQFPSFKLKIGKQRRILLSRKPFMICVSFRFESKSLITMYSKMLLLRPSNIKTTSLLRPLFASPRWYFLYHIIFDIKTTSLIRPLLGSPKGSLNIGILLYICLVTVTWIMATIFRKTNSKLNYESFACF